MKTSIFSLPDAGMTYMEAVGNAKAADSALEPFAKMEFARPDTEAARLLREECERRGVAVSCFSIMSDFSGDDYRTEVENVKRYADVAAVLGSPFLHHTLMPGLDPKGAPASFDWALKRATEVAREVAEYADARGVKCLYEEQGFVFNGCERFGAFLDEMGEDAGIVADLGNIYFMDETADAFVERFAHRVRHVHAKDYIWRDGARENPGEEWYTTFAGNRLRGASLGCGAVPFRKILRTLRDAGYDGYYSFEYDGPVNGFEAQRVSLRNLRAYAAE